MTIVKKGNPKAIEELKEDMIAECSNCDCIFTFGDYESSRLPNNGGGYVYFCKCPECSYSCAFDTGYPGSSDKDIECNRSVMERHDRLNVIRENYLNYKS